MNDNFLITLILKVFISAFATVGIIEFLKNFIKTSKTWIYSIIMPVIAIACFYATENLNISVIGSVLTVGTVQLCYQTLVQGFKKIINSKISKITNTTVEGETNENNS